MRKTAREQIKLGADFIKLMATGGVATAGEALGAPQFTVEEMTAAVEAAHGAGKRVAAHAIGDAGIRRALQAGVDTIEHGVAFDDETLDMMLQRGAFLIPTFSPAYVQATHGTEMGMPAYVVEKAQQAWETHAACVRRAAEAGVPVALGTDVGGPGVRHGDIVLELELMLSSGVCATELDCITAATSRGAEALGLSDELGTIECGKIADLLVVDGNPLQDLAVMRNIKLIIHNGQATSIDQLA
jgi:imidazolonepropionase-like amidohydrolase